MSQNFKLVKRNSVIGDNESAKKYYARTVSKDTSNIDTLCKLIAARSTVSGADAKAVLDNLNYVIDFELQSGRIVHLGELGNFRLSVGSEGVENESDFRKSMLRKPKIVFTPGKALQLTRDMTKFTLVKDNEEVKMNEGQEEDTDALGDL
jgi:DNA-binding protein, histone-like, putative